MAHSCQALHKKGPTKSIIIHNKHQQAHLDDIEREVSPEATVFVSDKSQGRFPQCGGIPSHVSDFDDCSSEDISFPNLNLSSIQ